MAKAFVPGTTAPYILKADRELPEQEQTTFQIGPLTEKQQQHIQNNTVLGTGKRQKMLLGTYASMTVQYGLKGWENLTLENGEHVPFEVEKSPQGERVTDKCMAFIAPYISELCEAIAGSEDDSGGDEGNSGD